MITAKQVEFAGKIIFTLGLAAFGYYVSSKMYIALYYGGSFDFEPPPMDGYMFYLAGVIGAIHYTFPVWFLCLFDIARNRIAGRTRFNALNNRR